MLSVIAGATDTIGFLGLGGLFTAHVTGNLVILAAHAVSGAAAELAAILAVPVFMLVLWLTRLLARGCDAVGLPTLQPLLLLQLLLLAAFLALGTAGGPHLDPHAGIAIPAGMFGVAAMAVQNALVQIALPGVASTAVMTSNVTHCMLDVGTLLVGRDPGELVQARRRAAATWPAIVGFAAGCGLGAASEAAMGLRSLMLPTGLALIALAMSVAGWLRQMRNSRP